MAGLLDKSGVGIPRRRGLRAVVCAMLAGCSGIGQSSTPAPRLIGEAVSDSAALTEAALKNLAYEGEVFAPDLRKLRRALARRERPA